MLVIFNEVTSAIKYNEKSGLVYHKQNIILPIVSKDILEYSEGLAVACNEDYKLGFIDKLNKLLYDIKYNN